MRRIAAAIFALGAACAWGQASEIAHPDAAVEERLKTLGEELRCLVCQNQTIADSNAPLALDLRNQIRGQVAQGRSDDQIRAYMVERYGDFVLYKPPFKATTAALWLGPVLLLMAGVVVFAFVVARRRATQAAPGPKPERRVEIEALLEERDEVKRATTAARAGRR
jgi:cytochrome c-type biogenesis protein CcmH